MNEDELPPTASVVDGRPLRPQTQKFELAVIDGPRAGTRWSSTRAGCSIGSHPSNDFAIEDKTVSRFHAEITLDETGAWVRDLDSRNATFVDNVCVRQALLSAGSTIRMGETSLRFAWCGDVQDVAVSERKTFGGLVGQSQAMREVFEVLERAAHTEATLLISGETGTGKDAAAEAVHAASARKNATFIVVDCGAVQANLIESELFGHERGAFTGAVTQHTGSFERANGGTIFLDEIGELPLELQPKLLRVLEQRTIQRVGGQKRIDVDVRVIAATNRDLRALINEGTFRADLYFRLAVLTVRMPPLRERRQDIPVLAAHLIAGLDPEPEVVRTLVNPAFYARLQREPWTGNIRELRNFLEQCVVLEHAPSASAPPDAAPADAPLYEATPSYDANRRRALDRFEKDYIRWLIDRHHSDTGKAAAEAGVTRRYITELLRRHKT